MSAFRIEFRSGAVRLPELGLCLDSHEPESGPERVLVSHAHSDHVAEHREVILSAPTARLMQARLPGTRVEHVLNFGERRQFQSPGGAFFVTLLPAGHILGSAMGLLEAGGKSLLYTGDFKLRHGSSVEPCEPRPAEILIMESTFGRPQYVFPPAGAVLEGVSRFCREALDNDETPVLLGYSLGKSQELMGGLARAGLPLMLHGAVYKLTKVYEEFGKGFPPYEKYEAGSARGKVLLCPPSVVNSAMLRKLGKTRTAVLTGWAVDQNCRYRYQADAAFALSDHADFPDLIEMVKRVNPSKVYTLHGFAADFAKTLRELGYDAQALSEDEQLALQLDSGSESQKARAKSEIRRPTTKSEFRTSKSEGRTVNAKSATLQDQAAHPFLAFAEACARIATQSSKLEKIRFVAEYLRTLKGDAIALAATWFSGRPFPSNQNKVLQLGWAVLRDALCAAAEIEEQEFHQIYLKHSDLGETTQEVLQAQEAAPSLSLERVNDTFQKLYAARGPLAKTPVLLAALEKCTPLEAKFLVKIITGDLRIGLKEGLVEEAVAAAFATPADEVRQANLLMGDIGHTALLASEGRLSQVSLVPFRPIKFMLASPEPTASAIWERLHPAQEAHPVWLEDKYDGIRCQLHKVGAKVALYSRDLKDVTTTFLDVTDAARKIQGDFILDGELVSMRGDEILPFAELQKRLGRRQGDLFMGEEVPVKMVVFDLLWAADQSYLRRPLTERRRALEELLAGQASLRLARVTPAGSAGEIDQVFDAARARGNEGLMIKEPSSIYTPGRRGLSWLKLKKAYATLDCVVVGAEYGHGKRNKVLSDYTFAVRDETTGELRTIGKAYSGLTDVEIAQLTEHFLSTAIRQHGRYLEVKPDTVLEIAFDKIQPSDRHTSGLALRFPRILRIRTDKPPSEIDTVASATKLAAADIPIPRITR